MKLYWSLKSLPELQGLSPAERKEVWIASFTSVVGQPLVIFGMVCCGLISGLAGYFGMKFDNHIVGVLICAPVFGGLGGAVYGQILYYRARPLMPGIVEKKGYRSA